MHAMTGRNWKPTEPPISYKLQGNQRPRRTKEEGYW